MSVSRNSKYALPSIVDVCSEISHLFKTLKQTWIPNGAWKQDRSCWWR